MAVRQKKRDGEMEIKRASKRLTDRGEETDKEREIQENRTYRRTKQT